MASDSDRAADTLRALGSTAVGRGGLYAVAIATIELFVLLLIARPDSGASIGAGVACIGILAGGAAMLLGRTPQGLRCHPYLGWLMLLAGCIALLVALGLIALVGIGILEELG